MEGNAVSGALLPPASGTVEAICDLKLEGMGGVATAICTTGVGFGCGSTDVFPACDAAEEFDEAGEAGGGAAGTGELFGGGGGGELVVGPDE